MKSASIIGAIFSRSKIQPACTYLWKAMLPSIKLVISDQTTFNTGEDPILSFYIDSNKWWLLTTERIILSYGSIKNIYISEIQNVDLNELFEERTNKSDLNTIQLKINNIFFDLEVEKRTWHVVFNMLKFMLIK
jgi:hypothetical protein